jgi:hypothetical protein
MTRGNAVTQLRELGANLGHALLKEFAISVRYPDCIPDASLDSAQRIKGRQL